MVKSHQSLNQIKAPASTAATPTSISGVNTLLLIIAIIGCVHAFSMLGIELYRYQQSNAEITRLSHDIQELESEVAHLQLLRENANNERYREELARSQGFVFPDEVRVITVH